MINEYPKKVFEYFYELSKIPHGSGNTKAISDYCVDVAKRQGLWYTQDDYNNVIIKKPASSGYENHAPVIIQGHLDMVCEKEDGVSFDFNTDGLKLKQEGDFITAEGTTLGADDGIAVAYALAILTSDDIISPPLEVIFTTDEETGMDGAINLDMSQIEGRMLMNIDSECEGVFTVSCAGGVTVEMNLPITITECEKKVAQITLDGLSGGHSGVEIDKNRANSNVLMSRLLSELCKIQTVHLVDIHGGHKLNAIASKTVLTVCFDENEDLILDTVLSFSKKIKTLYENTDPDMSLSCEILEKQVVKEIENTDVIANTLSSLHDGVYSMSEDIEGLVKTSSNFGILKTDENFVYILISVRSSEEKEKVRLCNIVSATAAANGASIMISGDYPSWEYKKESKLRDVMCDVFEKQHSKQPKIEAIHAGLECGIFCGKITELDCVSFGPDMSDIHTPRERLSISSTQRVWDFIIEVLKNL
ncbi:MAG: aminoacyl-histidine dipeptidase [Clostridia bacterium]|nr:aminoacyl-histidine dipeptidase [Clostridia bacterium]